MAKKSPVPVDPPAAPRLRRITKLHLAFTAALYDAEGHFLGEEALETTALLLYPFALAPEAAAALIDQLEAQLNGF